MLSARPSVTLGNDVVDLGDPETADAHLRERFLRRILCPGELALFRHAADPKARLWSLFAAKEAAYKAAVKLRPDTLFAHRAFSVATDLRSVRHQAWRFSLLMTQTRDWVHALAFTGKAPRFVVGVAKDDPSRDARRLLLDSVAAELGHGAARLAVARAPSPLHWNGLAPPRITLDGSALSLDVSLSHHGRFVACAHEVRDASGGGASLARPGSS